MPCDVTFLRLYWAAEEYLRLGLTGARELAAPDPAVVSDLGRALRMQVGVLPGIGKTHYAVEPAWGDPAFRIFAGAIDHDADLIVMGSESRHGWARLSHAPVASHVARDVLEVPVVFVPPAATQPCQAEVPRIFTVLAPTDLSATGSAAVPFAYTLAAAHGGVVELCHVHERALADPPYAYDRSAGQLSAEERTRLEAALRALVPSDAERLGITTHVTVIDGGKAAQAIVQAGERFVADAIVVGSHGKGGALRSLLGSVSHDVVRQARRPVLVVPSPGAAESNHAEGRDTP
jgi:nucleotide-binding universal stress UspA family protein